jgi:hypothetical protein
LKPTQQYPLSKFGDSPVKEPAKPVGSEQTFSSVAVSDKVYAGENVGQSSRNNVQELVKTIKSTEETLKTLWSSADSKASSLQDKVSLLLDRVSDYKVNSDFWKEKLSKALKEKSDLSLESSQLFVK